MCKPIFFIFLLWSYGVVGWARFLSQATTRLLGVLTRPEGGGGVLATEGTLNVAPDRALFKRH
jgi:hypothetical protein